MPIFKELEELLKAFEVEFNELLENSNTYKEFNSLAQQKEYCRTEMTKLEEERIQAIKENNMAQAVELASKINTLQSTLDLIIKKRNKYKDVPFIPDEDLIKLREKYSQKMMKVSEKQNKRIIKLLDELEQISEQLSAFDNLTYSTVNRLYRKGNTQLVGGLNTGLSKMYRSSKQYLQNLRRMAK